MTDYEWEIEQRKRQKDLFLNYRNLQPGEGNTTIIANSIRVQQSKPEVNFVVCFVFPKSTFIVNKSLFTFEMFLTLFFISFL